MTLDKSKVRFTAEEDYFPADMEPGELELLAAFDIWIHKNHANAERRGCPGRDRLEAVVRARSKVEDEYTLRHIGLCAACLDEMREMRRGLAQKSAPR